MTIVLGIETSCDETAAAVVRNGNEVLSNVVYSQVELHGRFRGVVPEIASRSHTTKILPVVTTAFEEAGVQASDLDAVAVTNRPGMIGCLLVGVAAAKALSLSFDLPLIGVDHIQGHIHAAFMTEPDLPLPCIAMVASGGHTALYLVRGAGDTERVGTTRDDAAGEALDKAAAMLGLPYPGGPSIQAAAEGGDDRAVALPRPRTSTPLDFSFSGIKTALLYHLRGPGATRPMPELSATELRDIAASYQRAIVDCLVKRLALAAREYGARSISIGGGVARNALLRSELDTHKHLRHLHNVQPPLALCSDNAAMIAGLGTHLLASGHVDDLDLAVAATGKKTR